MSPFTDFMQDVLDEVAASADPSLEALGVDWASGTGWVETDPAPEAGQVGWMRTAAGWVPLDRQGGSE